MDGAGAWILYSARRAVCAWRSRRAWGLRQRPDVSLAGAAPSADLGGSSKYSTEEIEDRRGEGFHWHSKWQWVSRS
jgi:hypothetical protein